MVRLLYWLGNLWLLAGAAGVCLLPILAPTITAFALGGIFLVGGMLTAWIIIEALPGRGDGASGRMPRRLRIRFAFLLTAPVIVLALLVRGDWFGAIWPALLLLGAVLRSLELLIDRSGRPHSGKMKPPFLGQ